MPYRYNENEKITIAFHFLLQLGNRPLKGEFIPSPRFIFFAEKNEIACALDLISSLCYLQFLVKIFRDDKFAPEPHESGEFRTCVGPMTPHSQSDMANI